ncbi:MAG TPA: Fic family protein [Blastocatellia bacterium]|nr:Fic family protein [Blastocatellia bacterium]
MRVADKQYYRAWLKQLKPSDPLALWSRFVAVNKLPPLTFSFEAAAVYSSNIEGNSMDLRAFLESKAGRPSRLFRAKERKEIEALVEAYRFARNHALNEKNLLQAHALLAKPLLPKPHQGRYRNQLMFVYSQYGIEYAAVEPEFVPEKMRELFDDLKVIGKSGPDVRSVFYFASLLHLVFVHIHPFQDGNGRAARLLEKWFLARHLGKTAWQIPSEQYYKEHLPEYYRNIKIGLNYHTLNYDLCVPFLTMLAKSLVR